MMVTQVMGPGLDAELAYRREGLLKSARGRKSRRGRAAQPTQEPATVLQPRETAPVTQHAA